MDLPWGDEKSKKFVTNVGLVTSNGPHGQNIMACEWTHHVSYSPGMIAICIKKDSTTNENIKSSKEFGVNLAAYDQNVLSSVAGTTSGKEINKFAALQELGFKFYNAKKIKTMMVEGAALNVECKLVNSVELSQHTMFIGEVVEVSMSSKEPLAFHGGKYWKLTESIPKPSQEELDRINKILEKHKKK